MPKSKKNKVSKVSKINSYGLVLKQIKPKNDAQRQVFESFYENHLLLHGYAGTGKTYLSLYLALKEILEYPKFHKIIIVRSAVQTRDQGFMPGTAEEKMAHYERPYYDAVNDLCGRGDAYDILCNRGSIEFMSTSFIRGITLDHAIVIVDEVQNMTFQELDTIMTRIGKNSKIVFCGDFRQSDLRRDKEKSGLVDFMKVLDQVKGIEHIEFQITDIVRSGLVRDYIVARTELNM
jgi:phosphate starvation-inducible protein PhoH